MEMFTHGEMGDVDLPVRRSLDPPAWASVCKAAVVHASNGKVLKIVGQCLMLVSVSKKVDSYMTQLHCLPFLEQIHPKPSLSVRQARRYCSFSVPSANAPWAPPTWQLFFARLLCFVCSVDTIYILCSLCRELYARLHLAQMCWRIKMCLKLSW